MVEAGAPARLPYLAMPASYIVVAKAAVKLLYPSGGLLLGDVAVTIAVVARQLLAADEYRKLAARYRHAATTDELTGQPTTALILDVDRFKAVNDTYGHQTGDIVLAEVAARCQACLRAGDLLCRYGGDELLVLLPNTDIDAARAIAERIVAAVAAAPVDAGPNSVAVRLSVGYATVTAGTEVGTLIGRADAALYTVKQHGRGRAAAFPGTGLDRPVADGERPFVDAPPDPASAVSSPLLTR